METSGAAWRVHPAAVKMTESGRCEVARRLSRKERKEQIIKAAAGVFAEKGFSKTLMAEVAAAADIGKGTVYEYFRSKDDLFFTVFVYFIQETRLTAEKALTGAADKDAAEKLRTLSRSLVTWIAGHRHIYTLSLEFWAASVSASPELRDRFEGSFRNTYGAFRKIVADIIQDGVIAGMFKKNINPRAMASGILGAWDGLGLQSMFDPAFQIEKTAEAYMELIINALLDETSALL